MSELNIGGSNMTVELRGDELYAVANTGNKQWVAVITDTHPKYNFDRDFVAYQKPRTSKRDSGTAAVEDGAVIERVRFTHSGKNRKDRFYQLVGGEAYRIDEADVKAALDGEIVADVPREPTDTDEWDTEPAIVRVHECDECGQRCASAHGVAVHKGVAHSEPDGELDVETASGSGVVAMADGGTVEIRDYQEARNDDVLVREYQTPPGELLYAYRDGDEHVVVSRGKEPKDRWTKRVPAERTHVAPGEHLWTIPDNWEKRVHSSRDNIAYGMFEIPETGRWVTLSLSTNDWLVDCSYGVQKVGDVSLEFVGDIASAGDVYGLADDFETEYDDEAFAEALREVARHWGVVKEGYQADLNWLMDEDSLWERESAPGEPLRVDDGWVFESMEAINRPDIALENANIELPDDISERDVVVELRDAGLLPNSYRAKFSIDDSDVCGDEYLRGLIEAGCSPAEAVDYLMTELLGDTQSGWARVRGKDQSTVSGNVRQAKRVLQ